MQIIQAGADSLSDLGSSMTGLSKSLKKLKKATDQLYKGSKKLSTGVASFNKGIEKIYNGAGTLNSGVVAIDSYGDQFTEGYASLLKGINSLAEGFHKFDKEGIQKLGDLAGDDLQNLLDRIRTLKKKDAAYDNFSGLASGQTGEVRFIIETDELE